MEVESVVQPSVAEHGDRFGGETPVFSGDSSRPSSPALPWPTTRQPFSPLTMGYSLPYLDIITVQSKRLLPVTRKELDLLRRHQQQQRHQRTTRPDSSSSAVDSETSRAGVEEDDDGVVNDTPHNDDGDDHSGRRDEDSIGNGGATVSPRGALEDPSLSVADHEHASSNDYLRTSTHPSEELLQSVRLLVEPIALPDLTHTGVSWQQQQQRQHQHSSHQAHGHALGVTAPNHTLEETQVKLFYPTGAKNTNMREYIRNIIQLHVSGSLPHHESDSTGSLRTLHNSQSAPILPASHSESSAVAGAAGSGSSPQKHKTKKASQYGTGTSPTKKSSPQKTTATGSTGVSSGARLSGSVSTSGLLNPELTRQTKDILAQLRANTNKINDLIGS